MDPITLAALAAAAKGALLPTTVIGTIIGGWIGNRTDYWVCKANEVVLRQLKNPGTPTNHDIQRAVRGAYLNATLVVCQRLIASKTNVIERFLLYPTADIARVVRYLKAQLAQLPNASFDIPTNTVSAQYELLLEPRGQTADQRTADLTQQLRQMILDELTANGLRVEADLRAAILTGLTDGQQRVDWYELVCAFFAEDLKSNARLSTITETNLLLEIKALTTTLTAQVPDVTWPDDLLARQTEQLGLAMAPLVAQMAELMTRLDEMLALLNEMMAVLVTLDGKVDRVQQTVDRVLAELSKRSPPPLARPKYLNNFARYDADRLIGRVPELADMDARLARQKMLLLRGMGGIGKTTLAKAYLDRHRDHYDHLAYVEIAGTIADSMLRELGQAAGVTPATHPGLTPAERFVALLDVLRTLPTLLLVLDNIRDADGAADLRACKADLESLQATVLITGRVRLAEFVQADQLLELSALMPDDARALFARTLGRSVRGSETAVVDTILEKTFYHAKLIEVVATQISRNVFLSFGDAKDLVANRQFDNDELNAPDDLDPQAQTIYAILLNLFDTDPLTDDLKQLLRYFAVLPAIDIPATHLVALLGLTAPADRNKLNSNLLKLAHTAWLDQLDGAYFSIHGLVQWVVRKRLIPTLSNCKNIFVNLIKLLRDSNEPVDSRVYIPFAESVLSFFQLFSEKNDEFIKLSLYLFYAIVDVANYHKNNGEIIDAEYMTSKAIVIEQILTQNEIQVSLSLSSRLL